MVSTAVGVKVGASVAVGGMRVSVGSAVTEGLGPQVGVKVGASGVAVGGIGVSVGSVVIEGLGPQQVTVTVKSSATIVRHLISFPEGSWSP
jgi:hypothetical protein